MVLISKAERDALKERFPNLKTVRTVNRIYAEERPGVLKYLRKLRESCISDSASAR